MTKEKLLKEIENKDDAIAVDVQGNCYLIYNPNNGNDDNTKMWKENEVEMFCLSFNEYKKLEYKNIYGIVVE